MKPKELQGRLERMGYFEFAQRIEDPMSIETTVYRNLEDFIKDVYKK